MDQQYYGPVLTPDLVGGVPLYLTGEDAIRLSARNAAAGVTLMLSGRFLPASCGPNDPPPRVQPFVHTLIPTTDRTTATLSRALGEGWLLEASVVASAGTPAIGQCFAVLSIVRGDGAAAIDLTTLAAGYVTALQRLAWPWGAVAGSLDGGGAVLDVGGAVPGAGADFSVTVPAGARWQLLSVFATLTTGIGAFNRVPVLLLDDGATVFLKSSQQGNQAASLAWDYLWAPGDQTQAAGNIPLVTSSLPSAVWLGPGYRIRSSTLVIQAADQWTAPRVLVREWIEGA